MTVPTRHVGAIPVSHHQFFLVDRNHFPGRGRRITFHDNGLAATVPGIVAICTGIHTGTVDLALEAHKEAPEVDVDAWEDVVEVSVDVPVGELHAVALMYGVPDSLGSPVTSGTGRHGVRVHARGRDIAPDGTASEPFESYLVQVWPTSVAADRVHKVTSRYGRGLRRR